MCSDSLVGACKKRHHNDAAIRGSVSFRAELIYLGTTEIWVPVVCISTCERVRLTHLFLKYAVLWIPNKGAFKAHWSVGREQHKTFQHNIFHSHMGLKMQLRAGLISFFCASLCY